MNNPTDLRNIRIITVSGRIGAGSTTLAKGLSKVLGWKHIEGGEIFWEAVRKKLDLAQKDTDLRPDQEDFLFDEQLIKILKGDSHIVLETKLAGFNAQNIGNVYKILVTCEDKNGIDQAQIRIDRLVNREGISIEKGKKEVIEREKNDLKKWRKLYVNDDATWTYFDPKYYDLLVNTFDHNKEELLKIALESIRYNE